jgi:hypothetical protein
VSPQIVKPTIPIASIPMASGSVVPEAVYDHDYQKQLQQAQKNAKFAISALQYDDIATGIDQLEKSLRILRLLKK